MATPRLLNGAASIQDIYDVSTTQYHRVGTRGALDDGRVFYYAKHSLSTTFTRGCIVTQPAVVANHQNRTVTATAGDAFVTIAIGATAVTAGQYDDGYFLLDTATLGIGQARRIKSVPVSAGSETLTVQLYDPIRVTATGTVTGSLQKNLYVDGVKHPGNALLAGCVMGVPPVAVPAGDTNAQYFWIQTQGWAACDTEGSVTAGQTLAAATAATSDAGQFKLAAGATTADDHVLALVILPNGTDEHFCLADLCIRG